MFAQPIVRVVHDLTVLVLAELVAVHDPLDDGLPDKLVFSVGGGHDLTRMDRMGLVLGCECLDQLFQFHELLF